MVYGLGLQLGGIPQRIVLRSQYLRIFIILNYYESYIITLLG